MYKSINLRFKSRPEALTYLRSPEVHCGERERLLDESLEGDTEYFLLVGDMESFGLEGCHLFSTVFVGRGRVEDCDGCCVETLEGEKRFGEREVL
jgi:hypothetical protein